MKRGNFNGSNFLDPLTYPITDPPAKPSHGSHCIHLYKKKEYEGGV